MCSGTLALLDASGGRTVYHCLGGKATGMRPSMCSNESHDDYRENLVVEEEKSDAMELDWCPNVV